MMLVEREIDRLSQRCLAAFIIRVFLSPVCLARKDWQLLSWESFFKRRDCLSKFLREQKALRERPAAVQEEMDGINIMLSNREREKNRE